MGGIDGELWGEGVALVQPDRPVWVMGRGQREKWEVEPNRRQFGKQGEKKTRS